jgi:cell division protein FtsA
MGGGTLDIAIYANGAIRHTAVLPIAGNQVTNDIAKIFRTPISQAEEIKVKYGAAYRNLVSLEDTIEVPSVGGRPSRTMSRHTLAEVIEPRYQEIFELIQDEIRKSGLEDQIAAGIVLTGGTSKMTGVVEYAEQVFHMPVRIGTPVGVKGLTEYVQDPSYATVVGLLLYGLEKQQAHDDEKEQNWWQRLVSWFKGEF